MARAGNRPGQGSREVGKAATGVELARWAERCPAVGPHLTLRCLASGTRATFDPGGTCEDKPSHLPELW